MDKHEPKSLAGDLSNEKLQRWMQGKLKSAHQLKGPRFIKDAR